MKTQHKKINKFILTATLLMTTSVSSAWSIGTQSGASIESPDLASGEVAAGLGYSDVSPHQIVRSGNNYVYIATPACISFPTCFKNTLAMVRGNKAGDPTSFSEQDAAHHPGSPETRDSIGSSAIAIDNKGIIWVVYNTRNYGTHAISFNTSSNRWGKDVRLGTASAGGGSVTQGKEGVAVAVDKSSLPHAVFTFIGSDKEKHIAMSSYNGSSWSSPVQIDDAKLGTAQGALHPTIAYTPQNELLVAWLIGDENKPGVYNNPDGTIHVREIMGTEGSPSSIEIPDTGDRRGNPGYAATVIDNGPSLLVTSDGVAHITYVDTSDYVRYWYSSGTNYKSWIGTRQTPAQVTHDPSLGPDGQGGLYIYGHGTPMTDKKPSRDGHGDNMYRFHLPKGGTKWSSFEEIISDPDIDCSVSTRWSQFDDFFPAQVDFVYWNDKYPNHMLYTGH